MGTFKMTISDLLPLIGTAHAPDIVDICLADDHALDPRILPGARQMSFESVAASDLGTSGMCVIVCKKGFKLSQGSVAVLRAEGRDALFLEGGVLAWANADLPLWPTALHPTIGTHKNDWVLPHDLTSDDLFVAWTILRWVDPGARWLFVDRDQIPLVCENFGAYSPREITNTLFDTDIALAQNLQALRSTTQDPSLAPLLQGACKIAPRSAGGIDSAAVIFDSLWATREGDLQ